MERKREMEEEGKGNERGCKVKQNKYLLHFDHYTDHLGNSSLNMRLFPY